MCIRDSIRHSSVPYPERYKLLRWARSPQLFGFLHHFHGRFHLIPLELPPTSVEVNQTMEASTNFHEHKFTSMQIAWKRTYFHGSSFFFHENVLHFMDVPCTKITTNFHGSESTSMEASTNLDECSITFIYFHGSSHGSSFICVHESSYPIISTPRTLPPTWMQVGSRPASTQVATVSMETTNCFHLRPW